VGDIIRIHRANIGIYKQYKTFSVNLAFGSAWCIFSGFDDPKSKEESAGEDTVKGFFGNEGSPTKKQEIRPYQTSSKDYTLTA
jgi:hypothetical protein